MTNELFDFSDLQALFREALGESIKESRIYLLGHPGRRAQRDPIRAMLNVDTDTPGMVYVHPLSARIPGQSDDTSEEPPRLALNEGKGKIRDEELIYGLPVYVRRDGNLDTIDGPAGYLAAEYLNNVKKHPQRSVDIGQFEYMLLRPASPATGGVLFTGGYPTVNGTIYQQLPRMTVDLIATYGPSLSTGQAKAIMIESDAVTDTLHYTVGAAFGFNPFTGLPEHATAWTTYYPKTLTDQRILLGWVRIYQSMTSITQNDILAAQELVGKSTGGGGTPTGDPVTYCGRPLWYDGEQVFYES